MAGSPPSCHSRSSRWAAAGVADTSCFPTPSRYRNSPLPPPPAHAPPPPPNAAKVPDMTHRDIACLHGEDNLLDLPFHRLVWEEVEASVDTLVGSFPLFDGSRTD